MMGYATPQELINGIGDVADTVYVDPAARAEYQRLMQRDGMVREFEYQVRAARRRRCSGSPTAPPPCATRTARSIRYEGTVRDITDQKRAEDAIAEGRRLLQMVIDTVPAVINVKDKQPALCADEPLHGRHFRHRAADAIGRTTTDLMSRYGAAKTDENDKRVLTARQGARLLRGGVPGFRRQSCGNGWSTSCRCSMPTARSRTSSPSRSISASASAANRRCARRKRRRRGRAAQSARDAELADRGGEARSARTAGGRRRARGQQSRRHQPDGRLRAGAQDRELRRRSRARRAAPLEPERFSRRPAAMRPRSSSPISTAPPN